jgi:hypothetical protein
MARWRFLCAASAAVLVTLSAQGATIVRAPDEVLVEQAPLVVVARVMETGPSASGAAATEVRLAVDEVLKGAAGPELTVVVPGGIGADGRGLHVYGAPSFVPGERTILFLEPRPSGVYRVLHLMQGAFREVLHEGRSLAVRDLADVVEMRRVDGAIESSPAAAGEPVREFDAFARWIGERAAGGAPAADYRVALPAAEEDTLGRIAAPANWFRVDGLRIRWFEFDTGGQVPWLFGNGGQPGVPGGGLAELQAALAAWNADSQTPILYAHAGSSGATGGLCDVPTCGFDGYDELNVILFGDPNDELTDLSGGFGTLAYGGPWFEVTQTFRGEEYWRIVNADIVINNGLEGFFNGSLNARAAAAELFGHELGHTLGIDHSCGNVGGPDAGCQNAVLEDALMAAFIHDDGRGAKLNSDDLAAARSLYRQGNTNPPPGNPPAAPSELAAEALSIAEIALGWKDNSANETAFEIDAATLEGGFVQVGTVPANTTSAEVFNLDPGTGYRFRVRATNANGDSPNSNEAQASTDAVTAACVPGAQTLCLAGDRFRVRVAWKTAAGGNGLGQVVPTAVSDDSGLFWFFDAANWEMLVKVLAACPVNDHNWVFFAATTNVGFTLTVTDTGTVTPGTATAAGGNPVRTYFNPAGSTAQTVTDTSAFATCP